METAELSDADSLRAQEIWQEYQRGHEVSGMRGKIAGIDPRSGRVWIGDSGIDVGDQMDAEGFIAPVYLVRVGFDYYVRKGMRR